MKFSTVLKKNLKLLFRNKESAYTIVFGPILIILLVSFAFMGSGDVDIHVGIYEASHTELSGDTIEALKANGYGISGIYPTLDECIDSVRKGTSLACMEFPDKEAGDETVPVVFYLDFSRINLVYELVDDLSGELDMQADEISNQLASNALFRMQTAAQLLDEAVIIAEGAKIQLTMAIDQLQTAEDSLEYLPDEARNVTDINTLRGHTQGLAQHTKIVAEEAYVAIEESIELINDLAEACDECPEGLLNSVEEVESELEEIRDSIQQTAEVISPEQLDEALLLLRYAVEDIEAIQEQIRNANSASSSINSGVTAAANEIRNVNTELTTLNARLKYTSEFLKGEESNAETITTPISTSLVSITVSDDSLSFAYPYLLVLVIMFIGLLLSSMLVVTDKTSRAAFRNFTTPTSDGYQVFVSFCTAFFILIAEIAIILLLSSFFVAQPLLLNTGSTLLIILVAIVLFTFLGMIIGYLASTQEAAIISSISVGSILLFVSNVLLPVERMATIAQWLSVINPYIVLSELLKKSMLYGVTMRQVGGQILLLLFILIILLAFTLYVQHRNRKRYFKQEDSILSIKKRPKPLTILGRDIYNPADLLDALDRMTREEFDTINPLAIPAWVESELKLKKLSRQLKTASKERMILKLDRYLKKHGKHIKR